MNLNFYQPENNSYLENLRATLNDQLTKLDQLKNTTLNTLTPQQNVTQPLQPQRYYLDCGIKEDWQEFLRLNYGITENQIFNPLAASDPHGHHPAALGGCLAGGDAGRS